MKIVVVEILTVVLLVSLSADAHPMYRRLHAPRYRHPHVKSMPVMYGPGYGPGYGGGPGYAYGPPKYGGGQGFGGGGQGFGGGLDFGEGLQLLASVALLGAGSAGAQGHGALGFLGLG